MEKAGGGCRWWEKATFSSTETCMGVEEGSRLEFLQGFGKDMVCWDGGATPEMISRKIRTWELRIACQGLVEWIIEPWNGCQQFPSTLSLII